MDLSKYKEEVEEVNIPFGTDNLNVSFRLNYYTPQLEEQNKLAQSSIDAIGIFKQMLLPMIAKWDLEDHFPHATIVDGYETKTPDMIVFDPTTARLVEVSAKDTDLNLDGDEIKIRIDNDKSEKLTVPLSGVGLMGIPFTLLTGIMEAIQGAVSPKKETPAPSGSF